MSSRLASSWCSFFGLVLGQQMAAAATLAVFLNTIGAESLPLLFIVRSLVDIPVMFLYSFKIAKSRRTFHLPWLLLFSGVILAPIPFLHPLFPAAVSFLAYLVVNSLGTLLTVEWGAQVVEIFSSSESRRAVPMVYSASGIGGMAAGALLGVLSPRIGTLWTLLVAAVPSLLSVAISTRLVRTGGAGNGAEERNEVPLQGRPVRLIASLLASPLVRSIALSTLFLVLLRNTLNYQYNLVFDQAFPQRESLASFLGWYTFGANAVALVLQIWILPRLGLVWGIGILNNIYSGALLVSLLGIGLFPALATAVAGRFIDNEGKAAAKTPLSGLFYDVLPPAPRRQARAFVLGFISPIGAFLSGLVLLALLKAPRLIIPTFTVLVSIAYYAASRAQAFAYRGALLRRLRRMLAHEGASEEEVLQRGLAHSSCEIREAARTLEMELRPLFDCRGAAGRRPR